ncbi:FAD-dependent oxidoreductase [Streptomyces hoynatensis]|uniref:FAD-binding protein n=1 Tax=Streptomyces hoynatensis TaxID=1141874 RepID=A0A3A9YVP8_9ACTN|nr:FAD-binding protein [Streptomyces hoynatensis]RKN40123.1 FAD-binding protein [Streptomyces hoynatensis]
MRVEPGDDQYDTLVVGFNQRYRASPEAVHVVRSTEETVAAVSEAVRSGKRLSVRSGGHCYADLVYHPQAEVIVDLSLLNRVSWDGERRAFLAEPGAQLTDVYETLNRGWGVTLPGGLCPAVGLGGHASGGGYGLLNRRNGVVADHVAAVEVVVADRRGGARAVVASRESRGDLGDLWWAICGGGGGTFGIVTRFWLRSRGATGDDPRDQLPRTPERVLVNAATLPYEGLTEESFTRLVRNFAGWCGEHPSAEPPEGAIGAIMIAPHKAGRQIQMLSLVEAALPGAESALREFTTYVANGTGMQVGPSLPMRWDQTERLLSSIEPRTMWHLTERLAVKSAFHKTPWTPEQCAAAFRQLTRDDYANDTSRVVFYAAGAQINTVPEDAVAFPHRDSTYVVTYESFWSQPGEDQAHVGWLRDVYGGVYAATGGYPIPGKDTAGCYINSPDPDILDPEFNTSGVPWHAFYFGNNYARLQRAKRRWDPGNVFRHSLSVRPD